MFGGITVVDKKKFIESVIARKLGLYAIVTEARAEIRRTEARRIIAPGSSEHVRFFRSLVFFLISRANDRPINLSDDDFLLLLPLAQHLVDQYDLSPDILASFGQLKRR